VPALLAQNLASAEKIGIGKRERAKRKGVGGKEIFARPRRASGAIFFGGAHPAFGRINFFLLSFY